MIWSEKGKQITKTGNEFIKINIIDEKRSLLAYIEAHENGALRIVLPTNEPLKLDKYNNSGKEVVLKMRNCKVNNPCPINCKDTDKEGLCVRCGYNTLHKTNGSLK